MNYSIPVTRLILTDQHKKYARQDLENIITQQVIISQLSNGITYADTENMDELERIFIFKKLIKMKKEENEVKQKAIEKARQGH